MENTSSVVLITGGSSGIGEACASVFSKNGYRVAINGRNAAALQRVVSAIEANGMQAIGIVADVTKPEDCVSTVDQTLAVFGRIDVLINNAGISMRALFIDCDTLVIKQLMDVNFFGMVYTTKAALPALIQSNGTIVGVSSIAGLRGLPARTGYSASKAAMQGFLEALRTELMYKDVNVLTVFPGYTASNIRNAALNASGNAQGETPLDEAALMQPVEVALAIYKATVNRKRTLVLSFMGKVTALLNKIMPGYMDKIVYNFVAKEKDSPFK